MTGQFVDTSTPFGDIARRLRRVAAAPETPDSLQDRLNAIVDGLDEVDEEAVPHTVDDGLDFLSAQ